MHLDNVDHAGHAVGRVDKAYYRAVTQADEYVGMLDRRACAGGIWNSHYAGDRRHCSQEALTQARFADVPRGEGALEKFPSSF